MSIKGIVEPRALTSDLSPSRDHGQTAFVARLEGDAVLVCSGELDTATTPALRRSLRLLLGFAPDRVVVDLSRVSFFGAGAIGELVRARTTSRAAGGDLMVRAPSPFGRRVLGVVGLTNLIAEEPERDTAPANASAAIGAPRAELVADRFLAAYRSGVVIDEAKGLIAERFDVGIDEASIMLRAFATAQHQSMRTAAVALKNRTVAVARVAPHRPGQPGAAEGDAEQGADGRATSRGS